MVFFDEGFIITRRKEDAAGDSSHTCQNPQCGKTFSAPLTVVNLSLQNSEPYPACPHCLMHIDTQEKPSKTETILDNEISKVIEETPSLAERQTSREMKKPGCAHHLGYLSERSSQEKMPEECITCTELVDCMLKNLKN
jgi:hypothetical protein